MRILLFVLVVIAFSSTLAKKGEELGDKPKNADKNEKSTNASQKSTTEKPAKTATSEAPKSEEPKSEEPKSEEPKSEDPKSEEPKCQNNANADEPGKDPKDKKCGKGGGVFNEEAMANIRNQLAKLPPVSSFNMSHSCADDMQFIRDSIEFFLKRKQKCEDKDIKPAILEQLPFLQPVNKGLPAAWLLQQLDSFGKIPSNILSLNRFWHGSYRECLDVDVEKPNNRGRYQGKYCYALLSANPLIGDIVPNCPAERNDYSQYDTFVRLALCMPSTCSGGDIMKIANRLKFLTGVACNVFCVERDMPYTLFAKAVIALFSTIAAVIVIATIYDYNSSRDEETEQSVIKRLLLCFSFYTNAKKIMDVTPSGGDLECLHGIRVLTVFWVVICRTYMELVYVDNLLELYEQKQNLGPNIFNNGTFCVDTFFTLSGFLLAYLWLKKVTKYGAEFLRSKETWIAYYAHRYIRLTPLFALMMLLNAALFPYFVHGPHEFELKSAEGQCSESWWTHLLYINNIVKPLNQCYSPAWYLANNMQFYALSPAILILLLYAPVLGIITSFLLICASMALVAIFTITHRFPAMLLGDFPPDEEAPPSEDFVGDYQRLIYFAPWARFPTYLMGVILAFVWQKYLSDVKVNKVVSYILWCLSFLVGFLVVFGLADYAKGNQLPISTRAIYAAFCRPAWSLCICWLLFACLSGNGGMINEFLSWRGWLPLSKISYAMFLTHATVIQISTASNEKPPHFDTHLNWIFKIIGTFGMTAFVSFFVSAGLEAPIIRIEKMIFDFDGYSRKITSASDCQAIFNEEKGNGKKEKEKQKTKLKQ